MAKPVAPSDHIAQLASTLEACDQVRRWARELAEQAEAEMNTAGVNPSGFAAACLYVAGRERSRRFTQAAVADAASVTTNTIRKHSETLAEVRATDTDAEEAVTADE